jgi:glycosyltransferase involved in cell wall biosynthesis
VIVTTEREARLVREIWSPTRVHVIPNGVDPDFFSPAAIPEAAREDSSAPTVTFTGDMGYFPNEAAAIFFVEKVLPLVRPAVPDVRFLIVGRNPSAKVRKLQRIAGIEVTGWVPDVRPYLAQTRVSVAPFEIATGIQNKILEAMACGLPVAGTPRAVQGLSAEVARLVEIGEDAPQLAEAVVRLLRDPKFAQRRGMESRRQVMADYSWEAALDDLLRLLEHPGAGNIQTRIPERQVEADLLLSKEKP